MTQQFTETLAATPQDCLRALQKSVGARFDWRIMTEGKVEAPHFVVEKRAAYARKMVTTFRIAGDFEPTDEGGTLLTYAVSGQPDGPLFLHGIVVGILLFCAALFTAWMFSPEMRGTFLLALLLVAILLGSAAAYAYYKWHSYMVHLRELHTFMQEFAENFVYG